MKKTIILFTMLFVALCSIKANGDPVATRSAMTLSCTPVAVHIPEVKLLDERCRFVLRDGYTEVEVRYLLYNNSKKDLRALPYGFPIDWYGEGKSRWKSDNYITESIVERGWRDNYVRNVSFTLNGRGLPWRHSADTILEPSVPYINHLYIVELEGIDWEDPLVKPDSTYDLYTAERTRQLVAKYGDSILLNSDALCRRWYYTELDIEAGHTVELVVRYSIENNTWCGLYDAGRVFNVGLWQSNTFKYDFSPAAYWGDGKAQRFRVWIDDGIIDGKLQYESIPRKGDVVTGLEVRRQGKGLVYETRDFDFAFAKPLRITYVAYGESEDLPALLSRRISPDKYSVRLSGGVAKYPVSNLGDMDLSTAAVLKPDADGNITIRIVLKEPVTVTGVLIYNGYTKDADTYRNNSLIDSLEYDVVWDGEGPSYWNKGDYRYGDEILLRGSKPTEYTWQGLTDAAIRLPLADIEMEFGFSWEYKQERPKVKEIIVDVLKVKPGAKYNDLCVSEIILLQ
ncbi:MAG: hypothetical protein J6T88_06235 [Bacteroidales bacterium]|nr:hypothetical protein [Bacteroidales bacterium]